MTEQQKLVNYALAEVGYAEKASNKSLDSKTANAGKANYTKYSRDLVNTIGSPYAQGVAWCDMFVDWCFIKVFGKSTAKKMINGWSAYTPTSAQYYKNMGRYFRTNPQVGDQIFFKNNKGICHTGIVTRVTGTYVYTVEGNTSPQSGVVANGGGVYEKKYAKTNTKIDGYGRPLYGSSTAPAIKTKTYTGTFPAVPPVIKKGMKGSNVGLLQRYLNWFGGYGLAVDQDFGKLTDTAVRDFQSKCGLVVDGQFGPKSLAMAKTISK